MEELKQVLDEMQQSCLSGKEKEKYFVEKYYDISNKYPMIIKKACEKNFDYTKMLWMVEQQNMVHQQVLTQHQASIAVGETLVNDHIKPKLNQ